MAALPTNFATDVMSQTLPYWMKKMANNITRKSPFLAFLEMNGRIQVQGGKTIDETIRYKKSPNTGWYGKGATLAVADYDLTTGVEYEWRHHYYNVVLDDVDVTLNMGRQQVFNVLKTKLDACKEDIPTELNEALLSATEAAPSGANAPMNGLGHLVNNKGTIAVGNITPTTATTDTTWWKSYKPDDRAVAYDNNTNLRRDLEQITKDVSSNMFNKPNLILTNSEMHTTIAEVAWQKALLTPAKTVNFLFPAFWFGSSMVLWDDDIDQAASHQNRIYVLNTKTLRMVKHSSKWMEVIGPMRLPSKAAQYWQVFTSGQLTIGQRRANAVWDQAT